MKLSPRARLESVPRPRWAIVTEETLYNEEEFTQATTRLRTHEVVPVPKVITVAV